MNILAVNGHLPSGSHNYCVEEPNRTDYYKGHNDLRALALTHVLTGRCPNGPHACSLYPENRRIACVVCSRTTFGVNERKVQPTERPSATVNKATAAILRS